MGKGKKRNKKRWIGIFLIILLVILAIVVVLAWWKKRREPYDSYQEVWTETLRKNAATQYLPYSGGYLKVSRDGAEAVTAYGTLAWNVSYDMNEPIASVCHEYAAVGEWGRKLLYMMDGTGALYWKNVPYEICEVETSSVGVTAVRMNDGLSDYIQLITLSGELLVEIKTLENRDGIPIDIDLSEDGAKLVTSYLVFEDGKASACVSFYNFGEVGQNYANNLTGVFKHEEVITQVNFMDNDTLCALDKSGAKLYKMKELPEPIAELSFTDPIITMDMNDAYLGFLIDNTKQGTQAKVKVYNKKAQEIFDREVTEAFEDILLSGEDIVLFHQNACLMMKLQGDLKFNSAMDGRAIRDIMPMDGKDKLLIFEEESVTAIQLTHTKEEN